MPVHAILARSLSRLGWLLLCAVALAEAEPVYRCRAADGAIAYQDRACAPSQGQTQVNLAPAPPAAPSPDYGSAAAARTASSPRRSRSASRGSAQAEPTSYECRGANGEVFYRHSSCPKSIARRGEASRGSSRSTPVSATPLSRSEACKRLARGGRNGREFDESVSTYERNAGRDPCRRY